jgi:proline dehydrogenase
MGIMRTGLLWASRQQWIERQFRQRRFARKAVRRFMPGEELHDALDAAEGLKREGRPSIITYLGENVTTVGEADQVRQDYEAMLGHIADRGLDTHVSVKLTHLGLDLNRDAALAHLLVLTEAAGRHGNFMWVDMESSEYVDITLDLYLQVRARHPHIGVCVQAYLYRTADDLDKLLRRDATIRLVKGAYREPATVAFPKKADVDENYFKLAERLLEHAKRTTVQPHAIATHDATLVDRIRRRSGELDLSPNRWEVDMLYGIRADAQRQLVQDGVTTRVLISYGDAWFAWYMRRLAERPANVGFVIRSMFGG